MASKLSVGTLDRLWSDARNWRAGLIYSCKEDPRIVVPKRQRWRGWTLNFAHAAAWPALVLSVVAIVLLLLALAVAGQTGPVSWFSALAGILVAMVLLCRFLASPKRFEETEC